MTDPIRTALERLLSDIQALSDSSLGIEGLHSNGDLAPWVELLEGGRYSSWLGDAIAEAHTALSAPTRAEGVGVLALELELMANRAADDSRLGDAHFLSRAAAVIQNQKAEIQRLKASALAQPAPPAEGDVGEVLQWPTEWSRRQRAQEAEMLCRSAGMTPGKEMQRLVRDARDGMPLHDVHDLISHAIPAPVPVSERLPDVVEQALIKAECALADIAEGEAEECGGDSDDLLTWAEKRAAKSLARIRPVMRQHGIHTSEWPPLPTPTAPNRPPLSPAAQAVLDAADKAYDQAGTVAQGSAAALRAAVDQAAPEQGCQIYGLTERENERQQVREEILSIAAELEVHQ